MPVLNWAQGTGFLIAGALGCIWTIPPHRTAA